MAAVQKKSVLFVCLGNICRSPIAEAAFKHLVKEKGVLDQWTVDSCGMGDWHVGKSPDKRGLATLKRHGVPTDHKARQITKNDYKTFDFMLGMDESNISNMKQMAPKDGTATIKLLGEFDPQKELIINDPYYGADKDFETVYQQCVRCCKGFLEANS